MVQNWTASGVDDPLLHLHQAQVYQEALQSAECSVVHLTQIKGDYPCDTFFLPLDGAQYRLWSASAPQRHKDERYSFLCYTRAGGDGGAAPQLPPGLASRHEEHQVRHWAYKLHLLSACQQRMLWRLQVNNIHR